MSYFKILKGYSANLPAELNDGYVYFTKDENKFYLDYINENDELVRAVLNAQDAETLTGASLSTILNSSDIEIPTSKAVLDAITAHVNAEDPHAAAGYLKAVDDEVADPLPVDPEIKQYVDAQDAKKQDKLVGTEGQIVSFAEDGTAVARDMLTAADVGADAAGSASGALEDAKGYTDAHNTDETAHNDIRTSVNDIDSKVITLVGDDVSKSVRTIANEELTKQLIPESAKASLDSLQEIAAWIQSHPDDASAMNESIQNLETNKVPTTRTVNTKPLSADVTLNASDVGALPASKGMVLKTVTLSSASWVGSAAPFTQPVTVSGILADETKQAIWPTPAISSQTAWNDAQVMCTGQAADSLTFSCKKKPTTNITVYVMIQEVI